MVTAAKGHQSLKGTRTGKNRTKTFNQLIGKESKQCEIPISQLEQFFKKTTSVTNVTKRGSGIKKNPFTEQELAVALKKTKDTAPGVDGLRYHHLEWFDPDHRILTPLYNECKEHRKIPSHWKEAETILLYKGGDESKPENWRPISLMPTIYKLYSSLWNRRIRSVKGVMSKCQRGFQEREGCNESIGILRTAIDVAKGRKKRTCHKCLKTKVKILAFADDMAILSDSKKQLQEELERMDDDCTPLKLIFKTEQMR
ncbi:unnamed protein product [Caenorhabditis sp. 36 PRJEB53466]|nr:unnamed protein product [Caenorhabditis sp. 36 PRJEB53466]